MARPSKFREDEYPEQIGRMAALGLPLKDIAYILGVASSTIDEWVKRPDVIGFYKGGRASGHENVSKRLYQQINEGSYPAMQFYLKTQHPETWSEKYRAEKDEAERAAKENDDSTGRPEIEGLLKKVHDFTTGIFGADSNPRN